MSFFDPKEFAEIYGIKSATLRSHVARGKLIKENGFINTEDPINKIYITSISPVNNIKQKKAVSKKISVNQKSNNIKDGLESSEIASLTLRKKKAELLKIEREAELKHFQIKKMLGELMPIPMVDKIVTINVQSIISSMESEFENIASIYCEITGADRKHLTEMHTRMRESLSRVVETSKNIAKDEIEAVIVEYSITRSRGEKK